MLGEDVADVAQFFGGKPVVRQGSGCCAEDLRKIGYGVARDRKGELGLLFAGTVDADYDERGSIQNGGERRDPRLVVMLRAEESQDGIREVAFHQLGGPALPIFQKFA